MRKGCALLAAAVLGICVGALPAGAQKLGTAVEAFVRDRNRLNEAFLSLTSGGVD